MTPEDMDLLAALGRARAGVRVETEKPYLVESRLSPLARREGYDSIDALITALRAKREERLIWAVVEALCRSETNFFRGREAFAQLRDAVLPALSQRRREAPIRIWSAACATGQEVYSIAMAANESTSLATGTRFEFFGSDLSERSLEKAQAGIYTQFEVQRGLPIRLLIKYFENHDDTWAISPRIRQMVRWKRINLLADLSVMGRFDVILLRGVLRGMEASLRGKVVQALTALLPNDGVLVVDPEDDIGDQDDMLSAAPGGTGIYLRDPSVRAAAAA
ncbi:CheR family methyltransferase [Caulobacter segnis]